VTSARRRTYPARRLRAAGLFAADRSRRTAAVAAESSVLVPAVLSPPA